MILSDLKNRKSIHEESQEEGRGKIRFSKISITYILSLHGTKYPQWLVKINIHALYKEKNGFQVPKNDAEGEDVFEDGGFKWQTLLITSRHSNTFIHECLIIKLQIESDHVHVKEHLLFD